MRGFWQKMRSLFLDVKSLSGIREEALFVMNLYYVGKRAHETLLTCFSQVKGAFLVFYNEILFNVRQQFVFLFNRSAPDDLI